MKSLSEVLRQAAQRLQNPNMTLHEHLSRAAHTAQVRLRQTIGRAQASVGRPQRLTQAPETTWMTLARPSFAQTRTPLRRLAEPIVAVVAISVLAAASGLAVMSLAGLIFACLLAIAILTQVFGLSLDVDLPA